MITVRKYRTTVRAHAAIIAHQKLIPCRSMYGNARNIGRDGITYQKVASAWLAILTVLPVSRQSQMIASIDTSGSDATSAPKAGLRFAISDTAAMMIPDRRALRAKYNTAPS